MYPSDYGYAANLGECNKDSYNYDTTTSCKGTDWLFNSDYQWTLTPKSSHSSYVFYVTSTGNVGSNYASTTISGVRPVLYLKSDVAIVGGTGVYNDNVKEPYIVELSDLGTTGGSEGDSSGTTRYYSWS